MTEILKEDVDYFCNMAKDYGSKLDELYNIITTTDWINIGTKPKHSIEKMYRILKDYKKLN